MNRTDARRMTRAGVVLSAGEIVGKLATLALFSVAARALGVHDFGIFSLGLGLGLLLSSLVTLGMDPRLVQLSGAEPESLSARLSSLLAVRLASCVVVVVVSLLVMPWVVDAELWHVLAIMLVSGCTDTLIEAFRSAASARHVQQGPAVVLVVQRVIALCLVVALLATGRGVLGVATAHVLASLSGLALMALAARVQADVVPSPLMVTREHVHDFLRSIKVTGINDIVSMALFRIDVVMLALLAGTVAVGEYTAAYRLLETVLFISWSIARVILPAIADVTLSREERSRTVSVAVVLVATLYLPYAAVLLTRGADLVHLIFGDAFVNEAVIRGLALAPLAFGVAQMGINALLALRPDPVVLGASVVALAANVGLNLAFIPVLGVAAAGLATSVAYALQAVIVLGALSGRGLPLRGIHASLGIALVGSLLAAATMLLPLPPLAAIAAGGVVFVGFWWVGSRRWDRPTHDLVRGVLTPGTT